MRLKHEAHVCCVRTDMGTWVPGYCTGMSAVRRFVANMANAVTNDFWSLACALRVYGDASLAVYVAC
jgi:hypothetical protein